MGETQVLEEEGEEQEHDQELTDLLTLVQDDGDDDKDDDSEPELKPHEPDRPPTEVVKAEPEKSKGNLGLEQLFSNFAGTFNKIISNADLDRDELSEVIKVLGNKVRSQDHVRGAVIEQWVAAVRAKADLNTASTRLLDSIAKLLSAAKNNPIVTGDAEEENMDFKDLLDDNEEDD